MKNIYQQLITNIYDKKYILIKKSNITYNNLLDYYEKNYISINNPIIDHSNWVYLWSKKIDNIEYQLRHIENKFLILSSSVNYYIGIAENAILYVKESLEGIDFNPLKKISHIRILENEINNPQNIIIDYESRDIAEYLKYIFFNDSYSYDEIDKIFSKFNFDELSLKLIYGRLLFPTFYFDMYDKIVTNLQEEKKIINIINRSEEYEDYLENIYSLICRHKKIPKITWL